MSKLRVQQYMDKHKLTSLFEDLMTKVVHEQPDDPVVYMIRCLYRKAGIPVPKELKTGAAEKRSPERAARRTRSPDKAVSQSWAVASSPDLVDRSYEKPWLSQARKGKQQRGEEGADTKHRPVRKTKPGWSADTKVTATTFDDLFEDEGQGQSLKGQTGVRSQKLQREDSAPVITKAWAKHVDLEDSEDPNYRSRGYSGPRCQRDEDDPLAGEIMLAKEEESGEETTASTTKSKGSKLEAEKHRQDLEKFLQESDQRSVDSGFDGERQDQEQDDAIELLEDPEDLMREGVTNIPKSGYKLSKILRERKEETNVKLNINLFSGSETPYNRSAQPRGFTEDYYESDLERPPTGMSMQSNRYSQFSPDETDEEFESVSQVVGPRAPVWSVPDSDGETQRQDVPTRKQRQGKLSSTVPVRFDESVGKNSPPDENIFLQGESKTWAPGSQRPPIVPVRGSSPTTAVRDSARDTMRDSVRSLKSQDDTKYGWNIPDGTEVSAVTDWTDATSARPDQGPKAY
ncbi:uncharacterized protein C8orf34 homolog [Mya arenaria]|uniref:uncharacterized protein C8orf34 homolog n=1 Tax=Mya arenaria TaxID=6604 RepID=UPI0022DF0BC5|nr:uncharacterized protein C8orf34 homolog [Mya arenaria]